MGKSLDLSKRLVEKSIEAFTMAIEIYNKPTLRYRIEGFSFFICNAWELMLKAHLIKTLGSDKIYYRDNPNRTITLENCIKIVFTNNKDPLRLNLEKIVELRNTSTHFITEEYEMVYVPLFQSCILNFNEKMMVFHEIDMTTIIPQNFLSLSVSMHSLNTSEIIAKYPEELAQKLISVNASISDAISENNEKFAIKIEHHHYITKDKDKATSLVGIDNSQDAKVKIVKELKDTNLSHKYGANSCIDEIKNRLKRLHLSVVYNGEEKDFNKFHFDLFCKYYGLKTNEKFCYLHQRTNTYGYSLQTIDFIVEEIKKDPTNIIENLRKNIKK